MGDTGYGVWGQSRVVKADDSIDIKKQVTAWKEFQKREEKMRQATGLSIGTRIPFEWDEKEDAGYDRGTGDSGSGMTGKPPPSRKISKKTRYEIDQLAVGVTGNSGNHSLFRS